MTKLETPRTLSVGPSIDDEIVAFNVGGEIFSTKRSTIERNVDVDSRLSLIFQNRSETARDAQGRVFFDRDGNLFRLILNFLRDGKLILPEKFDEFHQLKSEAEFYRIDRLINEIENRLNDENENYRINQNGFQLSIRSALNRSSRIEHFVGPLSLIFFFKPRPSSQKFLESIGKFIDLSDVPCRCSFPGDENLLSLQIFSNLHRYVFAKKAKQLGFVVSYHEDFIYLPIEPSNLSREELAQRFFNKFAGKIVNSNILPDETSENCYVLVENWFLPKVHLAKLIGFNQESL